MIELIVIFLATFSVTHLFVYEDGPFRVFAKLRERFPHSAFKCSTCLSIWIAIPITLLALQSMWFTAPFAAVGAVILLERL